MLVTNRQIAQDYMIPAQTREKGHQVAFGAGLTFAKKLSSEVSWQVYGLGNSLFVVHPKKWYAPLVNYINTKIFAYSEKIKPKVYLHGVEDFMSAFKKRFAEHTSTDSWVMESVGISDAGMSELLKNQKPLTISMRMNKINPETGENISRVLKVRVPVTKNPVPQHPRDKSLKIIAYDELAAETASAFLNKKGFVPTHTKTYTIY